MFDTVFRDKVFNFLGSKKYDYEIKDDFILLKVEVPGVSKDELSASYNSGNIFIKKNDKPYKSFYITEKLPIDFEEIEAELDKGVLKINLPIDKNKNDIKIK